MPNTLGRVVRDRGEAVSVLLVTALGVAGLFVIATITWLVFSIPELVIMGLKRSEGTPPSFGTGFVLGGIALLALVGLVAFLFGS